MTFTPYITYEEYKELGGTLSEDVFLLTERKAQRYLDYITFDRIPKLPEIPEVVKEALVEYMNILNTIDSNQGNLVGLTQYSNKMETFTFNTQGDTQLNSKLVNVAKFYLPLYLTARSVNFDVEEYLQQTDNNTE